MHKKIYILLLLIAVCFPARVEIVHGGRITSSLSEDGVTLMSKGVHLRHQGRDLFSQSARIMRGNEKVNFMTDVKLLDPDFELYTQNLFYSGKDNYASATSDVIFITRDSSLFVSGDLGEYFGVDSLLIMKYKPHLSYQDTTEGTILEIDAQVLEYDQKNSIGIAIKDVICYISNTDTTQDKIALECDSLVYDFHNDIIYAFSNVKINNDDINAESDSAKFNRETNEIALMGRPELKDANSVLSGDNIDIAIVDGKARNLSVFGNAKGQFTDKEHPDLETSIFESNNMHFEFEDGNIDRAYLVRQVTVDYFPIPSDSGDTEKLHVLGDSVAIWFVENQIDSVRLFGGLDGKFTQVNTADAKFDTLNFTAEQGEFSISQNRVRLAGTSMLKYDDMGLFAYFVEYDIDDKMLYADALNQDSLIQKPVLALDGDMLEGNSMIYNLETEKGRVSVGRSAIDPGFFWGEELKKSNGDTLYAFSSHFTTCDSDTPHYEFYAPKMKLIPKDKIFARPIVMYIRELPVFVLPFMVFPAKKGRHSGILSFEIGQFQDDRRYVKDIGYYIAPNDYTDIRASVDIDEDTGLKLNGQFRYALRYNFTGSLKASYGLNTKRNWDATSSDERWDFIFSHSQSIGKSTKIAANGRFVSNKNYLAEDINTPEERMNRDLSSSVSYSTKFWDMSLTAGMTRKENLETGTIVENLPKITLSKFASTITEDGFFSNVKYSYNMRAVNYHTKDSTEDLTRQAMKNTFGISAPISWKSYLTLTPSMNGDLSIFDEDDNGNIGAMSFTYSGNAVLATTLYGTFPIKVGAIRELKHIISPRTTYSWSPAFEDLDRFPSIGGISSGGSSSESMIMKIGVGNTFYLRYEKDNNLKKLPLFDLSTDLNYDFNAEERKFSSISSNMTAKPLNFLDMTLSSTHKLYQTGQNNVSGLYLEDIKLTSRLKFKGNFNFEDISKKWSINVSHYIYKQMTSSANSQWIKATFETNITKNWNISYEIYYDIEKGERISEGFEIRRDLHCWDAIIKWVPSGYRKGYYFKIYVKELPDIKIEGSRGGVR